MIFFVMKTFYFLTEKKLCRPKKNFGEKLPTEINQATQTAATMILENLGKSCNQNFTAAYSTV